MKIKEKLLTQTVVCMTIVALLEGAPLANTKNIALAKEKVNEELNRHYSVEDVKQIGRETLLNTLDLPETISNVIETANEISVGAYPIDKESSQDIKEVTAPTGGEVVFAGIDKELGICIRIKHYNKISTYGNLDSILVIPGDRIIKGEVIATYDSKSDKEFYYQLEDYMV